MHKISLFKEPRITWTKGTAGFDYNAGPKHFSEIVLQRQIDTPILYSFRRCPYAIRARMAVVAAQFKVELREVFLRNKPTAFLEVSPAATVPVLVLEDEILEHSLSIMLYVLTRHDPGGWLANADLDEQQALIARNDNDFKPWLDRYKYHDRYPEKSQLDYRHHCCELLAPLENRLGDDRFLFGDRETLADVAVLPFVRQFAHVDRQWFSTCHLVNLRRWLEHWLASECFTVAMHKKLHPWVPGDTGPLFPDIRSHGQSADPTSDFNGNRCPE